MIVKRGMRKGGLRLALWTVLMAGCGAPTEEPAVPESPQGLPVEGAPGSAGGPSGLVFQAPAEWTEQTPSSQMRRAQYLLPSGEEGVEDAEVAVFYFQGQGGSVQANLDRWVGQFTTPDGQPASGSAQIERRQVGEIPLTVLDVRGTYRPAMGPMSPAGEPKPNYRMISAVAETSQGPWFFRLTGPESTVGRWEESFQSFLNNLKPAG